VLCFRFTVVQDCSFAGAEQREPGYLSWVEIDTRINGLRVPLAFLRLSQQGNRVAKGSSGIDAINTLTRAALRLLRTLKARNTRRCCPLSMHANRSFLIPCSFDQNHRDIFAHHASYFSDSTVVTVPPSE
jgi:hypothetical protein